MRTLCDGHVTMPPVVDAMSYPSLTPCPTPVLRETRGRVSDAYAVRPGTPPEEQIAHGQQNGDAGASEEGEGGTEGGDESDEGMMF